MKNIAKMRKALFEILWMSYIKLINCIQVIFHTFFTLILFKSEVNFKLKVKMNKILMYGFQWG